MDFNQCVGLILKSEGGSKITRDPDDPGGTTKYGISQRAFPHVNIEDLTEDGAKELYKENYWDKIGCDSLPPALRYMAMDCAVNQGDSYSHKEIQDICSISFLTPEGQLLKFKNDREARYRKNPKFAKYGNGWLSRLDEVFKISGLDFKPS